MKFRKNLLASVLCLALAVLCVVGLYACTPLCDHEWGEWSAAESGVRTRTCTLCGKTQTESVADGATEEPTEEPTDEVHVHNWVDATCTAPKTCRTCGATEGEKLAHSFTAEAVKADALKSEATCTSAAVYYKSCAGCGAVSKKDTDTFTSGSAKGHIYDQEVANAKTLKDPATCEHAATYYKSCACGAISEKDTDVFSAGEKAAHSFTEEVVNAKYLKEEANCEHAAIYYKSCTCGVRSEKDTDTFTSGTKLEHNYEKVGETQPTCEKAGSVTYRCKVCQDEYSDENGAARGHDTTGVTATERATGNSCEYILIYTCQRDGCGKEVEGEKVYHHHYVATIKNAATCQTAGEKNYRCDGCGDTYIEVIPKSDNLHIWVKVEEDGNLCTYKCSELGCPKTKTTQVYSGSTGSTSASALKNSDDVELKDTNSGTKIGMDLKDLLKTLDDDKTIDVAAETLRGEDTELTADELKQVGDNPIYNFTIKDENGKYISNFGDQEVTITLPYELSAGEDVDSIAIWYIDNNGKLTSIKATYSNGYVTFRTNHFSYYTVTKLTPKQRCELYGHNYASTDVPGSCTKDGYTLEVCVRCHDTKQTNIVTAPGHKYTEEKHDATCTEAGYILYTCEGCGHNYKTKLNATGHVWEDEVTREATCSKTGEIKHTCKNCGESYTEQTAKLSHVLQETVIPATCETGGLTRHACKNCDYSYDDTYTPALGHEWSVTWVWAGGDTPTGATAHLTCAHDAEHNVTLTANLSTLVTKGTCSNYTKTDYTVAVSFDSQIWSDTKTVVVGTPEHVWSTDWKHDETGHWHECSCGAKDTIIPHSFGDANVIKEATCSEQGVISYTCKNCGYKADDTYTPALGHDWSVTWVWTGGDTPTGATARFTCAHDAEHNVELTVGHLSLNVTKGTCSDYTKTDYTATVIFDGRNWTDTKTKIVGTPEHIWSTEWKHDETGHWHECSCGAKDEIVAHSFGNATVTKAPTCSEEGEQTETCACGETKVTKLKANGEHTWLDGWKHDENGHWQECSCGAKSESVAHSFGNATVTKAPTCSEEGEQTETCACGETKITKLKATGEHTWLDGWKHDETGHWQECSCGAKSESVAHSFENATVTKAPTCSAEGEQTETCVCGETKVTKLKATGEHVYENGACKWCGKDENACDHTVLREVVINLGKHGEDGESKLVYNTCECGEVKLIDTEKSELFCDLDDDDAELKEWTDEDGVEHETYTMVCAVCGVTWTVDMSETKDGCTYVERQVYSLAKDGKTLAEDLRYTYQWTYHRERKEEAIDLSKYGACAGTLTVWKCTDCGEIVGIYDIDVPHCGIDLDTEPEPETVTDKNGVVHTILKATCKTCGLTVMTDTWEETLSPCEGRRHTEMSVYLGDTVIASQTETIYYGSEHEWEQTYELKGTTCEEGYIVKAVCKKCGQTGTWEQEGHYWEESEVIDFGEHGSCGGYFHFVRCKVCGMLLNYSVDDLCSFSISESTEVVDGVQHQIYVATCTKCGMKITRDHWEIATSCEDEYHTSIKIEKDGKTLFEGELLQKETHHEYEYTYTLQNPEAGCEGGWDMVGVCKTCGTTVTRSGYWCPTERVDILLKEYGVCGNYHLYGERCSICGKVDYMELMNHSGSSCNFSSTYEQKEIDGVLHTIQTKVCSKCGFCIVSDRWEEPTDEDCYVRVYEQYTYSKGDKLLIRYLNTDYETVHDYKYDITFDDPELGCEGGLTVVRSCRICGAKFTNRYTGHVVVNGQEFSNAELGCTHEHDLYVGICPCGRQLSVNWNNMDYRYDEESSNYYHYCSECGLTIRIIEQSEKLDSCTVQITETVVITQGDKELFSGKTVNISQNHSFGEPELQFGENGALTIQTICANCQMARTVSLKTAALTKYEDGLYYIDIPVTPETTARYSFLMVGERNDRAYEVELCRKTKNGLDMITGWGGTSVQFTQLLNAGESYVIRIISMDGQRGTEVRYALNAFDEGESLCNHESTNSFAVLPEGATSCEDGVWSGEVCVCCGTVRYLSKTTEHEVSYTNIDLAQYGGCYGNLWFASCACGKVVKQMDCDGCGEWSQNSYTDEAGHQVTVNGRRCDECGMKYTMSWYKEHDSETCTDVYYYTVMLVRNEDVIFNREYTKTNSGAHNYVMSAKLDEGAKDCTDGVTVTYTCSDCGNFYSKHVSYHYSYEQERIDLSQYGSVCGGYAHVYSCACGYKNQLEVDADCDLDKVKTDNWLTSECEGQQQVDGWKSFSTSAEKWTCAVTDPQCGFVIRYASHWVRDVEHCLAYLETVWQFGYDAETNTCKREVKIQSESTVYHEYTETFTETSTHYDCTKCGSYYYNDSVYDAEGNKTKQTFVAGDKAGISDYVYMRNETEYAKGENVRYISRSYLEYKYRNGDSYTSERTDTPLTELPFGDYGYSYANVEKSNGIVTWEERSAYVNYKGYDFDLYRYITREDWWEKVDYTYSFEGECTKTVHYTNKNGEDTTDTMSACSVYEWKTVQEATCSQPGESHLICRICSRVVKTETIEPDHNWEKVKGTGEETMYICLHCGMMNANGASGSIVMEDLTGTYGNGVNYVVGYYKRNNVSFTYYVMLIDAQGEVLLELTTNDITFTTVEGITAIAFSKAAVAAAAEKAGVKAGTSYQVQFVFVPTYDEGNFDYAVTFDDEIPATVTGNTVFPVYIEAGGEVTFKIPSTAASKWTINFTTLWDTGIHAEVCDANGKVIEIADYSTFLSVKLEAGKLYTVKVSWASETDSGWMALNISSTAVS